MTPLLRVSNLKAHFFSFRGTRVMKAVDDVSFTLNEGETLGIVGESGCGKTTTARLVLLQEKPTGGRITFNRQDILALHGKELLEYRRSVQVVFQDPYSSLSPRMRVEDIIAEPLEIHTDLPRQAIRERVAEVLELVGLNRDMVRLFPHEFSGGQRQRIAIARSLVTQSHLIVLDEPVSALDVSIRAQIITLLERLQQDLGVSYLFIGHDLATLSHISHRIAVMYLGQIVETASSSAVCTQPLHPYTQALFAAALPSHPDEQRPAVVVTGEVPSALPPHRGAVSIHAALRCLSPLLGLRAGDLVRKKH